MSQRAACFSFEQHEQHKQRDEKVAKSFRWRNTVPQTSLLTAAFIFFATFIAFSSWLPTVNSIDVSFDYHHYDNLTGVMQQLAASYPQLTRLYSIGKSEQGRELWVLVVSKFPNERPLLVPAVKYIGNMHGNEPVSREVVLHFANYLLENYGKLSEITKFVDKTQIHLLPSLNPDGFELANEGECTGVLGRYNARLIDLNRNFPDTERLNDVPLAGETRLVMTWLEAEPFVLSANFHGGALVASFPYDNYAGTSHIAEYSRAPDDDVFRYLATTYSSNHARMRESNSCGDNFKNGITNGAEWFQQSGSMQDYNYEHNGVMELTIELGCCKYPAHQYLQGYWEENQLPMLRYLQQVHMGIKGIVYDVVSKKPIAGAKLTIVGRDSIVTSTKHGEYFRILLPGTYKLLAQADGYQSDTKTVTVPSDGSGAPVIHHVYLKPTGYIVPAAVATPVKVAPAAIIPTAAVVKNVRNTLYTPSSAPAALVAVTSHMTKAASNFNALFADNLLANYKSSNTFDENFGANHQQKAQRYSAFSPISSGAVKVLIKNGINGGGVTTNKFDDSFPFGQPTFPDRNPIITDNTRELLLDNGTPVGHYTAKAQRADRYAAFWPQSSTSIQAA